MSQDKLLQEQIDFDAHDPIHRVQTPVGQQWVVEAESPSHLQDGCSLYKNN